MDGKSVKSALAEGETGYLRVGASKNRLGVLAEGSKISLYVNGHLVKTVSDGSFSSGYVHIFAAMLAASPSPRIQLDLSRVTVYTVERAKADLAQTDNTTAAALAGVLFYDDFSSEQVSKDKGWGFGARDDIDYIWSPGKLTFNLKQKNRINSMSPALSFSLRDYGIEIEAQPESNPGTEYGIIFRFGGTTGARTYYLFGVTLDGKYYLQKKIAGKWAETDPVSETSSPYIKQGVSKNRLGVLAEGSKISLYIVA